MFTRARASRFQASSFRSREPGTDATWQVDGHWRADLMRILGNPVTNLGFCFRSGFSDSNILMLTGYLGVWWKWRNFRDKMNPLLRNLRFRFRAAFRGPKKLTTPFLVPLGGQKKKLADEHPGPFHMGVPPSPPGRHFAQNFGQRFQLAEATRPLFSRPTWGARQRLKFLQHKGGHFARSTSQNFRISLRKMSFSGKKYQMSSRSKLIAQLLVGFCRFKVQECLCWCVDCRRRVDSVAHLDFRSGSSAGALWYVQLWSFVLIWEV